MCGLTWVGIRRAWWWPGNRRLIGPIALVPRKIDESAVVRFSMVPAMIERRTERK
jgi:hypothetical protein